MNFELKEIKEAHSNVKNFCTQSAETGVEKWTVDMGQMTCTYYDKSNSKMLEEQIPLS